MKRKLQDLLALHYHCFFELPGDDWSLIFQIGKSPFEAWKEFFEYPFKSFELSDEMLEKLTRLPRLYAADCKIKDLSLIERFKSLEFLDLSSNPVKLDNKNRIHDISTVVLTGCELKNKSLQYISGCLELKLNKNYLSRIEELLRENPSLEYLDISENHFDKFENIPGNKTLTELDCSMNFIENASELCKLNRLREIYLENNFLKNVDFLFELPELEKVTLAWNKFTDDYLGQVTKKLNELNIIIEEP